MRKSRKNRFDWYSVSQRFSIRKYYIGAVSVLLGSCLLLNGIQAAAETQVAENTQPQVELVTESTTGGEVEAARQVTFTYKVVFVDSNGVTIKEDTLTHSISTTEEKATYSHTLSNFLLPEGYSLASNQDNKLTVTLLEGEVPTVYLNLDVLEVVEEEVVEETPVAPPAEEAGTKEEQATEKVEEPTLETAEEVNPEEKVVAEVPQAPASETVRAAVVPTEPTNPVAQPIVPTSLEEAKHVLEQVTSEAEVLSSQAERLVATSDQENEALKTVAAATKLTATEATVTLNDSKATLEIVNAKIDAVRTNVEALVLELRKFLGTDVIEIALATTTDMNDGIGRPGYWTEEEEVLNKSEAVTTAVTKAQEQRIPAGYEVDPNPDRVTFLIYSLSNFQKDSEFQAGTTDGSYNLRYGTDYYITMSLDRIKSTGNIYARLVNKQDGSLVQEIEIPENTARHQFDAIKNGPKDKGTFSYRMSYTTIPFVTPAGVQSYVASININSGRGGEGKGSVVYSLLTRDTTSYNSYTGIAPTYLPDQVTNYYVKETALRPKSLLASYTHTAAISGDIFSISSPAEFADYELIESPTVTEAPAAANYAVGTPLIQFFPRSKSGRIIYITKEDGTSRFINFALNPDHVDFIESFKKYDVMSQNEFVVNGVEDLELNSRLATIEKYLADIETVKSDTSLSPDEQTNRLNELRTNYASEINSDANKFLITFVSQETAPLSANNGPDAITGSTTWSYTSNKYYLDGNRNSTFTAKLQPFYSDPLIDWAPNVPNSTGMLVHSKTEVDEKGRPLRLSIPKVDADGSPVMQNGSQVNAHLDVFNNYIAMFNFLNLNQNTQDYYYAEKGGVKVYYVDTTGTELKDPQFVFEHADTNTAYDTKSKLVDKIEKAGTDGTTSVYYYKEIDTAALKPASQNTNTEKRSIVKITDEVGIVERDTLKELTYVYELAGSVNVNYVDVDGNKLSGTDGAGKVVAEKVADTVNAKAGTDYDTIVDNRPAKIVTADGKTYELAPAAEYTVGTVEADHHLSVSNVTEVTGIHEAIGSVTSGITKEITFVYKEVTGKVIVNFKSIDGKELQGPRTDTEEGSTGRDYNTEGEGEVPPTITKEGKTYKLVPNLKNGNPTGKVTPGTTEVTYYYQLVTGDVVVNYENTDGKVIAPQVVDVNNGNIGDAYDTRDEGDKPEKIVEEGTGDVYYIKPAGTEVKIGNDLSGETGRVVEGTTQVTYIYEKAGNVKINYILDDAAGTTLKDSVMDEENAKPGTAYDTTDEGDKPETITKDGKVYRLKEVKADSAAENGDTAKIVAGQTLEVTYVYTEVKSDVVVEYYDTEGNLLTGKTDTGGNVDKRVTDTTQASVGTPYNTDEDHRPATITTADETIYHYIELKEGSAQPEGTVAETTTTVQYVYAKAGSVVIRYVKEDDKGIQSELQPNVLDEDNVKPGTPYDTTDEGNKPTTITTEDGKTYTLVRNEGHDETGEVAAGETKEITYVYKEVTGKVVVNFKSIDGEVLQGPRTDTEEGSTGRDYNTEGEGEVPPTITKNGKTYKLVPNLTDGNPTGKVTPGTTEVTYYYQLVTGDVVVNYENTDGKTIAPQKVDVNDGNIGDAYDTSDEGDKPEKIIEDGTGDVYYIKPAGTEVKTGDGLSGETGRVVEGTTQVTYIYEKAGNVKINYILDDAAGTTLKDSVMDEENAKPGTAYDTTDEGDKPETISKDGNLYRLKEVKADSAAENGDTAKIVAGQTLEVTYVYTEVKSDVVVEYYDTEGNLLTGKTDTGGNVDKRVTDTTQASVGTPYNTDEDHRPATITTADETIYHYIELKEGSAQPEGTVAETTTTVQYVYAKAGSVVIRYVKEDDKGIQSELQPNVLDEDNVKPGTPYDTTDEGNKPTTITTEDGKTYTLVRNEGHDETGEVAAGETKEITYVYKEVTGKVVVNFKSIDGEVLQGPRTDTEEGSTGRDYNTEGEGEVPPTITKNGKTYKLVPNLTNGNPTGKVTPGTTEVTYYYQLVTGDVVVNYENTDGKTIAPQKVDVNDGNIGDAYDTRDEGDKPEKIVEDGTGDVYYIKPAGTEVKTGDGLSGETGRVVEGTTQVTYIYEKAGNVKINYILDDAAGTTLKDSVMDEENAKPGTAYDTTDEGDKPETISKDGNLYRLKEVKAGSAAENGDTAKIVAGKTLEVTYVYTKVTGSVVINYVAEVPAEDGTVTRVTIKTSVTDEDQVTPGKSYDTTDEGDKPTTITTEDGKTYELIRHEGDETGTVVEGETKEVTYVYKEVTGKVVVNFKSTSGETLQDPRTDIEEGSTGRDYNTEGEGEVPPTITKDGKLYRLVPNVKDGNPTGKVTPGTTEVTYYYEPVIGDVIIKYTDTEGNTLKDTVIDEDDVIVGTDYDTTNEGDKPEVITTSNGKYVLVPSLTTATDPTGTDTTETGKVLEGTTTITYVYQKVANWIPLIPNVPENERPKTEYPFDPTEPDKEIPSIPTNPTTDKPVIPHVPGYTPVDPKDNTPLKPVDPEDPSKGYVPPTPETPGEDTLIPYVPVKGDVVIKYVDTDGNTLKDSVTDEDDVLAGTKYDTTDEGDKPTEIVRNGDKYVLVPSKTTAVDPAGKSVEETGNVVEGTTTITYVYQKVAHWIPLIPNVPENERPKTEYPFDPTEPDKEIPSIPTNPTTDKPVIPHVPGYTPVDPKDNTPLKPVDPEDPSKGYIPPTPETPGEDTLIPYVPIKGDVVINYVDTDGNILKSPVTDEDDVLAGTKYDTTDEGDKPTEIVRNGDKYVLVPSKTTAVDPAGKSVEETGSVVEGTTTITYVYQKVANWIPEIPGVPENERPVIPYPFDPNNPDVPVTPTPGTVIPNVPGYTPVDPKDNTPLTPVDPEDPSKGYVPPTPETPGEDTLIPYVPVKGDVVIKYVDTDGNTLKDSVTDEDDVLAGTKYDTTDEGDKPTEIVRNGDKYVLVPSKTTAVDPAGKSVEETGSVVEGTTTITYVYQKVANWIPLIPNVPENERPKTEYPFDPTEPNKEIPSIPTNPTTDKPVIPHVPGYTPVDPKDNTPLTPVDPEDPSKGYVPPTPETPGEDTLIPYVPVKGDVVIKYVDTDGNTLKDSVTDEDDVLAGTKYDTTDEGDKPTEIVRNGDKYVLVPSKTTAVDPAGKSVEETGSVVEGTTTITYVYQKVANWIPLIPNVPENERPKTEYPFDPTEPDKEIPSIPTNPTTDKPVIPHVPGYTPVDPKDNTPLTPVDPEDPSKGYVPPTPETPGEDTLIPYVPVKQGSVIVAYITEDGVEIKSPVTDTPTSPEGTPYDTTDNKPKTITYNGEEYELVRVDGTENGTVVEGDTKVTYVYRKKPTTPPVTPEVKQGTVVVTYITEDGVEIKSPVTDTPTSPEGTPYDTTDNKPKTITYNGEEYELVRVDGTENGTVVEGDTKVTYVYRKVVKPTPPAPAKPSVAKPVKSEKPKLPDTGEEESTAGMLGVLLFVSSLFGVRKRRRDQE